MSVASCLEKIEWTTWELQFRTCKKKKVPIIGGQNFALFFDWLTLCADKFIWNDYSTINFFTHLRSCRPQVVQSGDTYMLSATVSNASCLKFELHRHCGLWWLSMYGNCLSVSHCVNKTINFHCRMLCHFACIGH